MKRKMARGGVVLGATGCPTSDDLSFVLSRGCAVVPASMIAALGRERIEAMNGGDTDIISAEDALAEMDDEDD